MFVSSMCIFMCMCVFARIIKNEHALFLSLDDKATISAVFIIDCDSWHCQKQLIQFSQYHHERWKLIKSKLKLFRAYIAAFTTFVSVFSCSIFPFLYLCVCALEILI